MNKEKLIANWDSLKDETKTKILALADKEIKEDCFVPKVCEEYYYYKFSYETGGIRCDEEVFNNSNFDIFNVKTGNCFRTPEEALFAGNCDYFTKRFETYVNRHTEKLDWSDDEQPKYYAYYDCDDDCDDCIRFSEVYEFNSQGTVYASSQEILDNAIADIGKENFLKYVMKVEK